MDCFGLSNRGKKLIRRPNRSIQRNCPQCGIGFTVTYSHESKKYCSIQCYAEFRRTLVGEKAFNYGNRWSEQKKKEIGDSRRACGLRGPKAPNWKGGRIMDKGGYIFLMKEYLSPEDQALFPENERYIMEHRLVMARKLKRPLKKREHVHHINGVKDDNGEENLMVMDHSNHMSKHANVWKTMQRLLAENRRLREIISENNDFLMEVAS
jgi:endogenous inhibitor of DNA gyrase (YacG/DUF329 family)